ncbi:Putative sugar ABC transport system, permease protein YjfF [Rubellimicrobium mesophilum DSM 19309]|uniref:Putative sugar ABC transport system, permease protein YjfF n=1 Tax=Rubellimicrobium mesophilum DSM 19309 TaxID=442562 RepID=A0A017HMU2_9RHOB|nr:hypothetical protein [Rubellimicrobium mesophilum]EYD75625.1 Putative sugar ABC transport system, permease protein YjfF [Rubellimicrobium mesophilum DSM 19309]
MNPRRLPLYVTIAIFVLAFLLCWLQFPRILSTRVVGNLLTDNAYLGIAAVGMTVVILSGGIDLSVGSVIAFSGVFIAVMLRDSGLHPMVVFLLVLALTTAFGAAQGALIHGLAMPAFIVTLAGMFLARGSPTSWPWTPSPSTTPSSRLSRRPTGSCPARGASR